MMSHGFAGHPPGIPVPLYQGIPVTPQGFPSLAGVGMGRGNPLQGMPGMPPGMAQGHMTIEIRPDMAQGGDFMEMLRANIQASMQQAGVAGIPAGQPPGQPNGIPGITPVQPAQPAAGRGAEAGVPPRPPMQGHRRPAMAPGTGADLGYAMCLSVNY